MSRLADVLMGAVAAGFGGFLMVASRNYTDLGAAFPRAVGLSMIVLGIVLVAGRLIRWSVSTSLPALEGSMARRALFVVIISIWGVSLPWLGIVLASVVGIAGLTLVSNFSRWNARRILVHIVGHAAIFAFFYGLLAYGLQVPLPEGRIF